MVEYLSCGPRTTDLHVTDLFIIRNNRHKYFIIVPTDNIIFQGLKTLGFIPYITSSFSTSHSLPPLYDPNCNSVTSTDLPKLESVQTKFLPYAVPKVSLVSLAIIVKLF
jgi:hypothetical protein